MQIIVDHNDRPELVYLVVYDSGLVSLEYLLLSRHSAQSLPEPLSQPTVSLSYVESLRWTRSEIDSVRRGASKAAQRSMRMMLATPVNVVHSRTYAVVPKRARI